MDTPIEAILVYKSMEVFENGGSMGYTKKKQKTSVLKGGAILNHPFLVTIPPFM